MSPRAALGSDIFRAYFLLAAGLLIAAGLLLSILKWGLRKQITPVWATYKSWLIMAPLALGCVFAGRVTVILFFCVLGGFGFKEFARATALPGLVVNRRGVPGNHCGLRHFSHATTPGFGAG